MKLAIIIGSTRPNRKSEPIARWVYEIAKGRSDATFELVDLKDFDLPFLDEPAPAATGQYTQAHTLTWAARIAEFDGFIFVTPEYNHGPSAVLKNAIDYLFKEWSNKAAGFVGYGGNGGARAIEMLRAIMSNVEIADVRAQVGLNLATDFENFSSFKPMPHQVGAVNAMIDQVIAWSTALAPLRKK